MYCTVQIKQYFKIRFRLTHFFIIVKGAVSRDFWLFNYKIYLGILLTRKSSFLEFFDFSKIFTKNASLKIKNVCSKTSKEEIGVDNLVTLFL